MSEQVWHAAKKNNDFASFAPYLQKMLDLAKEQAEAVGYEDHPFDALVFEYEPSMTAAKLRVLFDESQRRACCRCWSASSPMTNHSKKTCGRTEYPIDQQRAFALEMAVKIGYDMERGRLDIAPHPFEISFTRQDVRITTRYSPTYFPMALFGTLHETGHALVRTEYRSRADAQRTHD